MYVLSWLNQLVRSSVDALDETFPGMELRASVKKATYNALYHKHFYNDNDKEEGEGDGVGDKSLSSKGDKNSNSLSSRYQRFKNSARDAADAQRSAKEVASLIDESDDDCGSDVDAYL